MAQLLRFLRHLAVERTVLGASDVIGRRVTQPVLGKDVVIGDG